MNISYHYYTVKTLAVKAGFDDGDAQVIAYYSQMVDDFVLSHRVIMKETPPSFFCGKRDGGKAGGRYVGISALSHGNQLFKDGFPRVSETYAGAVSLHTVKKAAGYRAQSGFYKAGLPLCQRGRAQQYADSQNCARCGVAGETGENGEKPDAARHCLTYFCGYLCTLPFFRFSWV